LVICGAEMLLNYVISEDKYFRVSMYKLEY